MIPLTRLDGTPMVLNADLLEWIEQTPDTVVVLQNGDRFMIRETPDEVVRRVVDYKRSINAGPAIRRVDRRLAMDE